MTLQKKYTESNNSREIELLKNYINVLDRVSDDLIYAQQKFLSVDMERMKDDKCIKYATEISEYRRECFDLKTKIKKANFRLHLQEKKKQKLVEQNANLKHLCGKKQSNINHYRTFISAPKITRETSTQLRHRTTDKNYNPQASPSHF